MADRIKDTDKVDQLNKRFARAITTTDPTFYEMADSVAKLVVGLFLKTDFAGSRSASFESFVDQVRIRLNEEVEAGKALEDAGE